MADEKNPAEVKQMSSNDLAFERTIMAESRTLMAWVRTGISMISFGFTIYKFFHESVEIRKGFFSPRKVGMFMILMGLLALLWGMMEHRATIRKLKKSYPSLEQSNTRWLAVLMFGFGFILFMAALFRQ